MLFMVALAPTITYGQDPNYTQFSNNPLYYNPAFTGLYTGMSARFSFRDLWPALPYDFKSYHFDADLGDRSLPGSGGVGIFVNTDNAGVGFIQNLNVGVSLAVRIPFSALSVGQIGVKASWLQESVKWDDFVFSDALSARYGDIYTSDFIIPDQNVVNMADFSIGGIVQFANEPGSVNGTVGLAVDHLFEPDQSFLNTAEAPLPRKWVAHIDMVFATGSTSGFNVTDDDALKINPGVIYQNQNGLNSVQAGFNLTKFGINLGLWYKGLFGSYNNSICAFLAGYKYPFADNFAVKFTYSYDMQMTGALQGTGGAHEISLILDFNSDAIFGGSVTGYGLPGGASRGGASKSRSSRLECSEFW